MESSKISYIYALSDPRNHNIRYIGQTQNPRHRLFSHITSAKKDKNHKAYWIKSLLKLNLKPQLEIICCSSLQNIDFWECHYISLYKSWGFDLTNCELGGNVNKEYSLEHRKKLSDAHKGNFIGIDSPNSKPIAQKDKKTGEIIGVFSGTKDAHDKTKISVSSIERFLHDKLAKKNGSGYDWGYISKEIYLELRDSFKEFYPKEIIPKKAKVKKTKEEFLEIRKNQGLRMKNKFADPKFKENWMKSWQAGRDANKDKLEKAFKINSLNFRTPEANAKRIASLRSPENRAKISERNKGKTAPNIQSIAQMDRNNNILCVFDSIKNASRITEVSVSTILRFINGKGIIGGGYNWKYITKEEFNSLKQYNSIHLKVSLSKALILENTQTGEIFYSKSIRDCSRDFKLDRNKIQNVLRGFLNQANEFKIKYK